MRTLDEEDEFISDLTDVAPVRQGMFRQGMFRQGMFRQGMFREAMS